MKLLQEVSPGRFVPMWRSRRWTQLGLWKWGWSTSAGCRPGDASCAAASSVRWQGSERSEERRKTDVNDDCTSSEFPLLCTRAVSARFLSSEPNTTRMMFWLCSALTMRRTKDWSKWCFPLFLTWSQTHQAQVMSESGGWPCPPTHHK